VSLKLYESLVDVAVLRTSSSDYWLSYMMISLLNLSFITINIIRVKSLINFTMLFCGICHVVQHDTRMSVLQG